jgi:hypothetical protein
MEAARLAKPHPYAQRAQTDSEGGHRATTLVGHPVCGEGKGEGGGVAGRCRHVSGTEPSTATRLAVPLSCPALALLLPSD